MKCLLVVNHMNDILFVDFDDDFAEFINREAVKIGLLEQEEAEKNLYHVDSNIFMQLFSPLVLANWALIEETKNPCSSVTLENGHIFVFKQVDDLLYICINGDGRETENALNRKILIFQKFVGFMFGPISDEIGHSRFEDKKARWNFLRRLLDTYSNLFKEEQCFLVEAVERLHVNQLVNEKCIELLERVMKVTNDILDRPAQHSLLLVNSKLLALYSDRTASELQTADILSIILLVQDIFPPSEKLEDMLSHSLSMNSSSRGRSRSFVPSTARQVAANKDASSDEYLSAQTTPNSERSQTPAGEGQTEVVNVVKEPKESSEQKSTAADEPKDTSETPATPVTPYPVLSPTEGESFFKLRPELMSRTSSNQQHMSDVLHMAEKQKETGSKSHFQINSSPSTYSDSADKSRSRAGTSTSEEPSTRNTQPIRSPLDTEHWRQMVFLRTPTCTFYPHQLHCTQVLPGIVLVVVIEARHGQIAPHLCQMFQFIKDLISGQKDKLSRARSQILYDVMNSLLAKIQGTLKRVKGDVERVMNDVKRKWDNEGLKNNLLSYLETDPGIQVSTNLETSLSELMKKLKELFSHLYLSPQIVHQRFKDATSKLRDSMKNELSDYRHYLSVKAQRNIPMTSYLDEFPGMIHFIYIDRQSNQLTAPSLNITSEETGKKDATHLIKQKVWAMVEHMMVKLSEGYTSIMYRDGDFYFSYFLWFEDNTGNPLPVQQPFKPGHDMSPPGVLTGSFYRHLIQKCFPNAVPGTVHCYELYLQHVGLVNPQYIAEHCRQLARKLWEMSGEAYTPISLL